MTFDKTCNLLMILPRSVFRPQSKNRSSIVDVRLTSKDTSRHVYIFMTCLCQLFSQKGPLYMLDMVLNAPLACRLCHLYYISIFLLDILKIDQSDKLTLTEQLL